MINSVHFGSVRTEISVSILQIQTRIEVYFSSLHTLIHTYMHYIYI